MQVCATIPRLQAGSPVDPTPDLSGELSVVSVDMMRDGARPRLIESVERGAVKARPKLVGFVDEDDDESVIKWALYIWTPWYGCTFLYIAARMHE